MTKSFFYRKNNYFFLIFVIIVVYALIFTLIKLKNITSILQAVNFELTPWASVGGCGAGGSGVNSSTAKWIGEGVSGGLINIEMMSGLMIGRDFSNKSLYSRFSYKPGPTTNIGITLPVSSKFGPLQPTTALPRLYEQTGGFGDLGIDVSKNLGMTGQYCVTLAAFFPTGQYNIIRGYDQKNNILPLGLQNGTGLISPSIMLSYTKDVEDGLWIGEVTYSHPIAARISGKNEFIDSYYSNFKDSTNNKRFYYHVKPYGENDLGDYVPPSICASVYYGYRADQKYTHSFGLTFSAPLGVAWIHEESIINNSSLYNPRPDPDHKAWSGQISYAIERSDPKFPLFLAISKPIHDKTRTSAAKPGKWDGPDFQAFLNEWSFSLGIKATLF